MNLELFLASCMPIPTQMFWRMPANYHTGTAKSKKRKFTLAAANVHIQTVKERGSAFFSRIFHLEKKKEATMDNRKGVAIHLPYPLEDHSRANLPPALTAVQAAKSAEKFHQYEQIHSLVQKGLNEAINYCRNRDTPPEGGENSEIYFHEKGIPSITELQSVLKHYVDHKNSWKGPTHLTNLDWPCSLLADQDKQYLLFPLIIGKGGKKAGIYLGMDLATGENVVISKIESEISGNDFKALFFPSYMMNKLKPLFSSNKDKGGLLPLHHIFDITHGDIQQQFVVQKLCKGGDLASRLSSSKKLSPKEMKVIAKDIVNGLRALHNNNMLHKDLKPENVFLDNGRAFLGDYDYTSSLRKSFQENPDFEAKNSTVGSFPYLPPETVLGGDYGIKSEVWGAGLVLFSLLCGEQPQVVQELSKNGPHPTKITYSTARFNSWNPWRKEDPETKGAELVSKMMSTEPDERYSLEEVYEELMKIPHDELSFNYTI